MNTQRFAGINSVVGFGKPSSLARDWWISSGAATPKHAAGSSGGTTSSISNTLHSSSKLISSWRCGLINQFNPNIFHNLFTGKGHGTIRGCHPMWADTPEVSRRGCQTSAGVTWGANGPRGLAVDLQCKQMNWNLRQFWLQSNNSVFSIVWSKFFFM